MRRLIVLAATAALVLAAPLTAEAKPSAKPKYQVTAVVTAVTSEVGKAVKVTGKVTGKSAAGKFVSVQRKNGTGAWSTVARAKVTKKRTYVANVKMTNGGKTSIRVIMPATKSARSGTSTTRTLTVYRWLPLVKQSSITIGGMIQDSIASINGTKYPTSLTLAQAGGGGPSGMIVKTNKLCTQYRAMLGFDSISTLTPGSTGGAGIAAFSAGLPAINHTITSGQRLAVSGTISAVTYLTTVVASNESSAFTALGNPQIRCAADALPSLTGQDLSILMASAP